MLWFFILGTLGLLTSIIYTSLIVDIQYANTPADTWVLIGGVTSSSANVRIRLAHQDIPLPDSYVKKLVVTDYDLSTTEPTQIEQILTNAEHQTLHSGMQNYGLYSVEVTGLQPQTKYRYTVTVSESSSATASSYVQLQGTFATPAPEGTAFSFKIAAASCAWTGSTAYVFDSIRTSHPDLQLFLHLGDFHYADNDGPDMVKRLDAVSTVLHSQQQSELFRQVPINSIWDDHDYLGNQEPGVTPSVVSRDVARLSYQIAFPHYPLAAAAADTTTTINDSNTTTTTTTTESSIPIYHAFTIGTVRFIVTDLLSESNETNIYSTEQKEWLFSELQQADQYDFVVWATSKPWIGSETESNRDDVYGSWMSNEFSQDRSELSTFITDVIGGDDGPQNLLVVGGDAHMVAFDDGTNTYFGEEVLDGSTVVNSFPILQSAPLDRLGSTKGGPFSTECMAFDLERTQQYSTLSFEFPDESSTSPPCIQIESYRVNQWYSQERILTRRLCGKIFRPAVAPESTTCPIQVLTTTTLAFFITGIVLALILGCAMCSVSFRDPRQDACAKTACGLVGSFVAWIFAGMSIFAAVLIYFLNDVGNYDLRIGYVIAMSMLVLMCFVVMIINCCCFKQVVVCEAKDSMDPMSDHEIVSVESATFIQKPSVTRQQTSATVSEDKLPEGIVLTGGQQLRADGLRGQGVRVAVIDSGVDKDHPGFNGKVTKQVWIRSGTSLEQDDHGTHVAGTIHLMAPDAEIYDYRVFGRSGELSVDRAIAKAIRDATDAGCQIINMSLGGPAPNNAIWDAVQYANSKAVLMVCAAGNEGDNNPLTNEVSFPASYKECISIAAVSKRNGFPVAVFSNSNAQVEYAGIGVDVTSFKPFGGYQIMSGTSMACPHVAGLIACLMSSGGNSTRDIRSVLNNLAIDIDAVGIDDSTGVGFVTYLSEDFFDDMLPRATSRASSRSRPSQLEQEVVFSKDPKSSLISSLGSGSLKTEPAVVEEDAVGSSSRKE